jgi:hypothetical protein
MTNPHQLSSGGQSILILHTVETVTEMRDLQKVYEVLVNNNFRKEI